MPLQYPTNSPYNPYQEPQQTLRNWPKIILITLVIFVAVFAAGYFAITSNGKRGDNSQAGNQSNNQGIAVGEPNPNGYDCTRDVYNCANFTTQSEAQVAFDYCRSIDNTGNNSDPWHLDADKDGKVCEGLG